MTLRVDTDFLIHALATGGAPSARSWTGFPIVRRVRTASEAVAYRSVGIECDPEYFGIACQAVPRLANYQREQAELFQTL